MSGFVNKSAFFENLKLRPKFFLIMAVVFVGFVSSFFIGAYLINQVRVGGGLYKEISNRKNTLEAIALLKSDLNQVRGELATLLSETDQDNRSQIKAAINELKKDIDSKFSGIIAMLNNEEKKIAIQDAQATWTEFITTADNELLSAINSGNKTLANELATGIQKSRYERFIEQVGGIADVLKLEIDEMEQNTDKIIRSKVIFGGAISGALFLIILGLTFILVNSISKRIRSLRDFANTIASGDLLSATSGASDGNGDEIAELGDAINKMAFNLKDMIAKIVTISQNVSRATENVVITSREVLDVSDMQKEEIQSATLAVQEMGVAIAQVAQSTKSLSQVAHETSAAVMETKTSMESIAENANINSESAQETASIIEELLANIKQVAESTEKLTDSSIGIASSIEQVNATTKDIDDRAKESVVLADAVMKNASERGMKALNAAIQGMKAIKSDIFSLSETVNKLGKKSVDIGKILNVIDDVADRTTLLALNAAILASQSGEHGKGFAVVAEEIKALAHRTTESTSEISGLIKSVQAETGSSVKMVSASIKTVESGMRLVNDLNETLRSIIESSRASTSMASAIQKATEEEALVINNITTSVEHMTGQTGKIASAIQEQSKGSNFIIKETEKVRNLSGNIHKAVNEQKEGTSRMAELAEDISEQTIQIAGAIGRHEEKNIDIVKSMDKVRGTSSTLADASNAVNEIVSLLHKDALNLLEEMNKFKV